MQLRKYNEPDKENDYKFALSIEKFVRAQFTHFTNYCPLRFQ